MALQVYKDLSGQLNSGCYDTSRGEILLGVCHNTVGPKDRNPGTLPLSDQAANYLCNNDRQVSAHYLVGAEGVGAPVYRIVPEQYTAYHCGGTMPYYPSKWTDPDTGRVIGQYALNQVAIGIEVFGQATDIMGPKQLAACKALVIDIATRNVKLRNPKRWAAHAKLEADRTDGLNWVNFIPGWLNETFGNQGASNGGDTVASNTTDNTLPDGPNSDPNAYHCKETDKWVTNDQSFLSFFRAHGSVGIFGLPLNGAAPSPTDPTMVVQDFERLRLEYHADKQIYIGRSNAELLELKAVCKGCAGK